MLNDSIKFGSNTSLLLNIHYLEQRLNSRKGSLLSLALSILCMH